MAMRRFRNNGKRSKYGNVKVTLDGIMFDSRKEAERYAELKMMEKAGVISNLQLQVKYPIIESYLNKVTGRWTQPTYYVADFVYIDEYGNQVIEDVKGYKTPEYRLKKKLMESKDLYIKET